MSIVVWAGDNAQKLTSDFVEHGLGRRPRAHAHGVVGDLYDVHFGAAGAVGEGVERVDVGAGGVLVCELEVVGDRFAGARGRRLERGRGTGGDEGRHGQRADGDVDRSARRRRGERCRGEMRIDGGWMNVVDVDKSQSG